MRTLLVLSLLIPIVLQLCIVFLLFRRKLQNRFFWFTIYSFYILLEATARLVVSGNEHLYFETYWFSSLLDLALEAVAIWESFRGVLWLESKQRWFHVLFWVSIGLVLGYVGLRAYFFPPQGATRVEQIILDLEIAKDYLIAALGLLYFGLVRFFKVIGHQRESSVIWGFGADAVFAILGYSFRSTFGTRFFFLTGLLPAIGYIVAELAWTRDLLREEQKVPEPEISLEELAVAMKYYTQLLYKYLGKEVKE